jgi:hypothetical protein
MPYNSGAEGFQKNMSKVGASITEPPAVGQRAFARRVAYRLGRRASFVREAKHPSRVPLFRDPLCEDYNFMRDY